MGRGSRRRGRIVLIYKKAVDHGKMTLLYQTLICMVLIVTID
jgi:hypothetical protein